MFTRIKAIGAKAKKYFYENAPEVFVAVVIVVAVWYVAKKRNVKAKVKKLADTVSPFRKE